MDRRRVHFYLSRIDVPTSSFHLTSPSSIAEDIYQLDSVHRDDKKGNGIHCPSFRPDLWILFTNIKNDKNYRLWCGGGVCSNARHEVLTCDGLQPMKRVRQEGDEMRWLRSVLTSECHDQSGDETGEEEEEEENGHLDNYILVFRRKRGNGRRETAQEVS